MRCRHPQPIRLHFHSVCNSFISRDTQTFGFHQHAQSENTRKRHSRDIANRLEHTHRLLKTIGAATPQLYTRSRYYYSRDRDAMLDRQTYTHTHTCAKHLFIVRCEKLRASVDTITVIISIEYVCLQENGMGAAGRSARKRPIMNIWLARDWWAELEAFLI